MSVLVSGISAGYDQLVLRNLDLKVEKGSFTILLGPNGCGKSTLLKSMARILPLQNGQITIDEKDLHLEKPKKIAQTISFLPQNPIVPSGITVEQLVGYGRAPYQSVLGISSPEDFTAIEKALSITSLMDLRHRLVTDLSGGQRQRVFIAMNLAQDTPYMMLDEPNTFLDIRHQYETLDLLWELNRQGRTCLLVLHDIAQAARYASHLVMMADGKILAQGQPSDIVTTETVQEVFGLRCQVFPDPVTGTPLLSPEPSRKASQ